MDAFEKLFKRQSEWQANLYNRIGRTSDEYPMDKLTFDRIVDENLYNAIEEIIEARRHISCRKYWNPKKSNKEMSEEDLANLREEIIDVFHFLMTALIYSGATYTDIQAILLDKMGYNDIREDHKA